ncbi:hypothetical protein CLV81_1429 [Flagellimonas meridianipacifica]|uniref:Uncharacterized protein n=1 Tax=Flagellimonas meridianipacifica TaxID=1080225 RepID=A0A2T0MIP7_9FLAO|nr:hypothetical protein CLV81_1429 [Allomuricauda pacifica]
MLVGYSLLILVSCGITEIDPPEIQSVVKFLNNSDSDINVVLTNWPLSGNGNTVSLNISAKQEMGNNAFVFENDQVDEYFSIIEDSENMKIELIVSNQLVREWAPPVGSFGKEINNPFNKDSWRFESLSPPFNNDIVGKIVFTITDEDIGD